MFDDLLPLLSPPPAGPSQDVRWRQGTIVTFDQTTLQNTVDVGGTVLVDLPILGVAEAASLVPDAVVGLLAIESTLGIVTYAILGRLVTPNTPAAADAITQVARGIVTGFVAASETTTSVAFTDLATPGPAVTLTVRASGKVLIFLAATISVAPDPAELWGGFMNVQLTGANTIAPAAIPGGLGYAIGAGGSPDNLEISFARMIPLDLTPGQTTFTAKYAIDLGASGETARFRNRSLAVFAL